MKKVLSIYFLLFNLFISTANAQQFFTKTYSPYLENIQQDLMPNDDIILAGGISDSSGYKIIVNRFNKCGELIWSKSIHKKDVNLEVKDIQIDKNQNIILAGNFANNIGNIIVNNVFLISLSPNGLFNYFKVIKLNIIYIFDTFSVEINKQNEILLYFENQNRIVNSLVKFTANGQLLWMRLYSFAWNSGAMCATSDGGAIIAGKRSIVKVNDNGIVQWTKGFENSYFPYNLFEIPNGIVLFRYSGSSKTKSYAVLIDHNGNLKWNSQLIPDFDPIRGIFRKNGHLLFVGKLAHPSIPNSSSGRIAFLEIDTANGTILKTLVQKEESLLLQSTFGLNETSNENIITSGSETLTFTGSTYISKITKQSERISCEDTLLHLNYPRDTGKIIPSNAWVGRIVNFPIIEPNVELDTFKMTEQQLVCQFSPIMPKLFIDLGNDTILCTGNKLVIGDSNSLFENYQWSSGATTPTIKIDTTGTYWLKVWNDCDATTFSDSIHVAFQSLPTIDLGNDTTLCYNSQLTLFADTNATHYLWSTDDTTSSLQVDKAGSYWLKVSNVCDTLTDTINVSFYPKINFKSSISTNTAFVNDSIHFQLVSPSKFFSLLWNFDDGFQSTIRNPWHVYEKSGTYQPNIILTDSFGCKYDSIFQLLIQDIPIQVPNVFTPNGDGINDVFEIRGTGLEILNIRIYDRWGQLTYQTNNTFWDGKTTDGHNASTGTYYYLIEYQAANEKSKTIQGTVMLIR